jgi:cobaltochelatase CobT
MQRDILILRETVVRLTQLLAGMGLVVTQRGTSAYVETDKKTLKPRRVNIPHIPDNASPEMILAIQGFIDHEVAHILFTKWEAVCEAYKHSPSLGMMHNLVEDTFIERAMGQKFPGAVHNMGNLYEFFLDQISGPAIAKAETPEEEFNSLVVLVLRAWSGQRRFDEWLTEGGWWKHPLVASLVTAMEATGEIKNIAKIKDSFEALRIARVIHDIIYPPKRDGDESDGDKKGKKSGSREGDKTGSGESSSDGALKPSEPKDEDDVAAEKPKADDKGETSSDDDKEGEGVKGDETDKSADEADEEGEAAVVEDEAEDGPPVEAEPPPSPFEGLEISAEGFEELIAGKLSDAMLEACGDVDYLVYSKDFDVIAPYEVDPVGYDDNWLTQLENETMHMVGPMQKDIERMMAAQDRVLHIPAQRRGRMHSASLHKIAVKDDRIFRIREEHHATNTAVSLVIDNSGSMRGMSGGAKIDVAMGAAYVLSQTLERVRVAHECIGFTTVCNRGRTMAERWGYGHEEYTKLLEEEKKLGRFYSRHGPIWMPIFKDFDERITSTVKKRFADVPQRMRMNGNTDGESLEYAAQRLLKRREKRKVMIVLSDGEPCGEGSQPLEEIKHMKQVVPQLQKAGIELVGIGIMSHSVRHFYDRHVVLYELAKLPAIVMGELKRILVAR